MTDTELRAHQNALFVRGGYVFPTLRDVGLRQDIERVIGQATERWRGGRVLDIACGNVDYVDVAPETLLVRTDVAEEAARTPQGPRVRITGPLRHNGCAGAGDPRRVHRRRDDHLVPDHRGSVVGSPRTEPPYYYQWRVSPNLHTEPGRNLGGVLTACFLS